MAVEKKTEQVTLWLPESLKVDLMHLAADDDRKLSDYLTHVLTLHCYGQRSRLDRDSEAQICADQRR
jgi:inner membrane protein involved in colicin E2 resistance